MPLAACVRCKKLFTKEQSPICPECQPDEDADIEKVRGIIADSPDMNAEQVADKAEVEVGVVLRMIEGGIIEQVGALESAGIVCGRCGAPAISASKKLCQACLDKLNAEVAKAQASIKMAARKDVQIGEYDMNVHRSVEEKRKK